MKEKPKKKFNPPKRTIKTFIKDENGFITKGNILKIGLGTVASFGIMSSLAKVYGHPHIGMTPNTLWSRTRFPNHHENGLVFAPHPTRPSCRIMEMVDQNVHLNHVSTDVNGYGTATLHGKGSAVFDYDGPANGVPPRPY